jgi:transcriptional regulator with XRE-family HTH domain
LNLSKRIGHSGKEDGVRKQTIYGKKIRELREGRAWTQEHLAAVAGVSPRTIQRVEKNRTQDAETINAIAAAFNVDVERLRTTYLVPESRLIRSRLVTTVRDFVSAEREPNHAFVRVKMVPLKEELEEETNSLLDQVFSDRVYVEPDEPELWQSYVDSVREPLQSLFDLGLGFFLLDERRDLLLPSIAGQRKSITDHIDD